MHNIKKRVFSTLNDDKECTICHEPEPMTLDNCFVLNCGHTYHKACVKPWLIEQSTCPTCRDSTTIIKKIKNTNENNTGSLTITTSGIPIYRSRYINALGLGYSS